MPKRSRSASRLLTQYGRAVRRALPAAANAITLVNEARRSYTRTRRGARGRYGAGVTNQYDRTNVYRKRRMPRFKRKRWTRFIRKVKAAENTTLGTRTRVFNSQITFNTVGSAAKQIFKSVALYPCSLVGNNDDLLRIMEDDGDIANTGKIQMISGVMDMTLVNISKDAEGNDMGIELDVYMCTARKRLQYTKASGLTTFSTLEDALEDGQNTAGILGAARCQTTDRGATPFDMTAGLSAFGVKILSKKKYFLPKGNQMTYQIRDPKNYQIGKNDVRDIKGQNKPGVTKFLLLVAKGLPGAVDGQNYRCEIKIGLTRKYAYKINEEDEDKNGLVV